MKKILTLLTWFSMISLAASQTVFEPKSTITSVTVYEQGAMVTRSIDTKSIDSDGIIVLDSLPVDISPKSLQAKCGSGLKIISVKNGMEWEIQTNEVLKDSLLLQLKNIQDSIDYHLTLMRSIKKEIEVIHKNDEFDSEDGINMEQLTQATVLYKTKLRALDLEYLDISKKKEGFEAQKVTVQSEIAGIKTRKFQNVSAEIKVEHIDNRDKSMTISYYNPMASWYTYYDLRIADEDSYLDQKAYVAQSTGEDWKNVRLTLSNRNPNKGINPPQLTPYLLQNMRHQGYKHSTAKPFVIEDNGTIYGKITDEDGSPIIGASVIYHQTEIGTISDIDGNFALPRLDHEFLLISYIGYQNLTVSTAGKSIFNIQLSPGVYLDEVVITGTQSSASVNGYKKVKKKPVRKAISVKSQKSLNVHNFEVENTYTIPSNGEEYDVLLKTNAIPFLYKYMTLPSTEPTAYLKVGLPDWRTYDLFSGKVNLFQDGHYTGVSKLSIEEKSDTLWFSLGEDVGVHVEKERVEEYNKKSFFKNKITELYTYDLIVKNNKEQAVDIEILDQVPISTDDDIKVKVLDISGAEYDEKNGFLTWNKRLEPGQQSKVRISYELRYGKNVDITVN